MPQRHIRLRAAQTKPTQADTHLICVVKRRADWHLAIPERANNIAVETYVGINIEANIITKGSKLI
jgi:hypothetical protein